MMDDYNTDVTMVYNDKSINLIDTNKKMMVSTVAMALWVRLTKTRKRNEYTNYDNYDDYNDGQQCGGGGGGGTRRMHWCSWRRVRSCSN
jgi:hypothetical protein